MNTEKVWQALKMVEDEIAAGGEFGVAEERASLKFKLNSDEVERLREEYDGRQAADCP